MDDSSREPRDRPRFGGITTFNRLPWAVNGDDGVDLAVLGIPFDGYSTFRPGARFGPRAIRQASVLCRDYSPELGIAVLDELRAVDAGDVDLAPFRDESGFTRIEARVRELQQEGAAVVSLGGDHSILLPILRATAARYPGLCLIQIDAHSDTTDTSWGEHFHHGTQVRRAIEEGLVRGERVFQLGLRGPLADPEHLEFARSSGVHMLDMRGFHDAAARAAFLDEIRRAAGTGPCYVSFDVDGVDPAFAPGTGTPVVGGLTSFQALDTLRSLKGLRIIGGDVVEVAPAYDHAEITSLLAAAVVFEIMALVAAGRDGR